MIDVILIDDDAIINFVNRKQIEKVDELRFLTSFMSGKEALKYLSGQYKSSEGDPLIIFLDILMPDFDGFDFLELFSELAPEITKTISVVVISSTIEQSEKDKALAHPAVIGFYDKPLTTNNLTKVLQSFHSA